MKYIKYNWQYNIKYGLNITTFCCIFIYKWLSRKKVLCSERNEFVRTVDGVRKVALYRCNEQVGRFAGGLRPE